MTFCDETAPGRRLSFPDRRGGGNETGKNKDTQRWEGGVGVLHDRLEAGLVAGGGKTRHRDDTTLDYAGASLPKMTVSFSGGRKKIETGRKVL